MNLLPGETWPVIVESREGKRIPRRMVWGLRRRSMPVPNEAMTHARSETLLEREMFADLVPSRRCIVPLEEWEEHGSLIRVAGEQVAAIAGLYDAWSNPDGSTTETFCVVTVEAEEELRHLNTRRPAILTREDEALWLSRSEPELERILAALHAFSGTFVIEPKQRRRQSDGVAQQSLDLMPPRRPE